MKKIFFLMLVALVSSSIVSGQSASGQATGKRVHQPIRVKSPKNATWVDSTLWVKQPVKVRSTTTSRTKAPKNKSAVSNTKLDDLKNPFDTLKTRSTDKSWSLGNPNYGGNVPVAKRQKNKYMSAGDSLGIKSPAVQKPKRKNK